MQAALFNVYDIDGTLTEPGHEPWYPCARSLCAHKDLFDKHVAEWKTEIQSGIAPFDRSPSMMNLALLKRRLRRSADNLIDDGWSIQNRKHYHLNLPDPIKFCTWSPVEALFLSESRNMATRNGFPDS